MLSYDAPVSINGPPSSAPTNITSIRNAMASSAFPLGPSKTSDRTMSGSSSIPDLKARPVHHHVWLVTGPAGCGKTTVAQHLAEELALPYVEGDDVSNPSHP